MIRYGQNGRKASWIVKRYGKCGWKVDWIEMWKYMENMDNIEER